MQSNVNKKICSMNDNIHRPKSISKRTLQRPRSIAKKINVQHSPTTEFSHTQNSTIIGNKVGLIESKGTNLPTCLTLDKVSSVHDSSKCLWEVKDTSLKAVPFFYPPLNPQCTAYISDASPLKISARITECLRKNSILADFDNEKAIATAMTVDRCNFVVNLFRGRNNPSHLSQDCYANYREDKDNDELSSEFLQGVIVECVRIRGCTMTFHRCVQSVLSAAQSHSTGEDNRNFYHKTSIYDSTHNSDTKNEMKLFNPMEDPSIKPSTTPSPIVKAVESLEHITSLLKKDRLEPQQLGMEALVALTDHKISGQQLSIYASLVVLGISPNALLLEKCQDKCNTKQNNENNPSNNDPEFLEYLYTNWIIKLIKHRVLQGEAEISNKDNLCETSNMEFTYDDPYHSGILRSLTLRAFANALENLSKCQHMGKSDCNLLDIILNDNAFLQSRTLSSYNFPSLLNNEIECDTFLSSLIDDITKGAYRQPNMIIGTSLASIHETHLSLKIFRLLSEHSTKIKSYNAKSESMLYCIEKLQQRGTSTHLLLESEASKVYDQLIEVGLIK